MAEFIVDFNQIERRPLDYKGYISQMQLPCTELPSVKRVLDFNNTSADFNLGADYTGETPVKVRLFDFEDTMTWTEAGSGIVTTVTDFFPDVLIDDSTGQQINFPYEFDLSNITNIHTYNNNSRVFEFYCSGDSKYKAVRKRLIKYLIIDEFGQEGPIRDVQHLITES